MSTWTPDDLDAIGGTREIRVAPRRDDGSLRSFTTVWVVRVDDELYVRSYYGPRGSWYRAAQRSGTGRIRAGGAEHDVTFEPADIDQDRVDAAYHSKYGGSSHVATMTADETTATTLRVLPVGSG